MSVPSTDCVTVEDETDMLSWSVCNELPTYAMQDRWRGKTSRNSETILDLAQKWDGDVLIHTFYPNLYMIKY